MSTHLPYGASMSSPPDMEGALYELAAARSSAGWMTSNVPSSRRPRSTRITKPGSAGSSPQRMPRRRTTTSHKSAKYRSDLFPQPAFSTQVVTNVSAPQTRPAAMSTRPLSWHPSSMMSSSPGAFSGYVPAAHRLSIGPFETVDFNGMPTPMAQATVNEPFDGWFHLDDSTPKLPYVDSLPDSSPFQSPQDESLFTYPMESYGHTSYPMTSLPPSMASQTTLTSPHEYTTEAFPSMPPTSFYSTVAFTAPPTPDALPIQQQSDPLMEPLDASSNKGTSEAKANEPELIGMGLYDAPTQTSFLFEGPNSPSFRVSPPMGKGLKLEETWEPPSDSDSDLDSEDDADGEDDDDVMSDGMNTAFESAESLPSASLNLPLQQPEPLISPKMMSPMEPLEPWSPPQDDLAGRSFYMEEASPVTLESDAAHLWLMAMMTHTGAGPTLAT